jgi:hypothetical protein
MTGGQSLALAGLVSSIGAGYAAQAQGYMQQAGYAVQAQENLRMAGLRADKEVEYAELQAGRKQFQTQLEQLNYKVQANNLLSDLRKTNAAARARAAANGVAYGGGSAMAVQQQNVAGTFRDVGMVEFSALVSRVFGMEDATNILKAGYDSAFYEREAALANARSLQKSGQIAAAQGGLLAGAKLVEGGIEFAKTFPKA